MALPQATVTSEHSWFKHSFWHTASAELHLSGSNFQTAETLQKVCVHVLVHSGPCVPALPAPSPRSAITCTCCLHTPSPTPRACLLTEQELAQSRKHDFLCEPGLAAVEKASATEGKETGRGRKNGFGNNQPLKLFLELPPPTPKIFRAVQKNINQR